MLSSIPYTTFPEIEIGPLSLRTFGLVVAVGVLLGAWLAARYGEEFNVPRDTTYSLAMRMVIAGLFGLVFVWLGVLRQPVDLTMVIAVGTMLFGLVAGNLVGWLIGDWILARRR